MGHKFFFLHEEIEQHFAGVVVGFLDLLHIFPLLQCVDDLFGQGASDITATLPNDIQILPCRTGGTKGHEDGLSSSLNAVQTLCTNK